MKQPVLRVVPSGTPEGHLKSGPDVLDSFRCRHLHHSPVCMYRERVLVHYSDSLSSESLHVSSESLDDRTGVVV